MKVTAIRILKDNYVWALIDEEKKTALIIDPGEAQPVIDFLQQHHLHLLAILVTHHHWDHTNGIEAIKRQFPVPVYGPANENITGLTHPLSETESITIEGFPASIAILDIPGHTSGHIAYYLQGKLFCGDTLFAAGCGRLFEGTATEMKDSLQKIMSLPDETEIYCAHEYTVNNLRFAQLVEKDNAAITERIKQVNELRHQNKPSLPSTLKEEKETNPFLRCELATVKSSVEKHAGEKFDNSVEVFKALRKWKDSF